MKVAPSAIGRDSRSLGKSLGSGDSATPGGNAFDQLPVNQSSWTNYTQSYLRVSKYTYNLLYLLYSAVCRLLPDYPPPRQSFIPANSGLPQGYILYPPLGCFQSYDPTFAFCFLLDYIEHIECQFEDLFTFTCRQYEAPFDDRYLDRPRAHLYSPIR